MTMTMEESPLTRSRVEWATVPRVNLLPPEILEGRRFRRTQVILASVVAATIMVCVLATVWAQHQVGVANRELGVVAARTAQLQAQARAYAEVPRVLARVDSAKAARERAMSTDVLWYRFLDELAVSTPTTVWLGTLNIAMTDGANAAAKDPLTPAGYGEVTVTGTATRFPEVAQWLTSVVTVRGMDVSRLQTATLKEGEKSAGKIAFTSAVTVTADALSHRYDRKAG
ncbi:MAG: PilN domain-containing protein [Kineosporiaceae bacterium]|jgi:Tfp pilus assembly protein PilN